MPPDIRQRPRRHGSVGSRARIAKLSPADRSRVARGAAAARWIQHRFGAPRFAILGLPGGTLVDAGLADLAGGSTTKESLLLSLAAPRLRREGVPLVLTQRNPENRLYRLLERTAGDLAHAQYNAYLRQIVSFADACRILREKRKSARRGRRMP